MLASTTERLALLESLTEDYARGAIANVTREYPNMPWIVADGPGPLPTHRESHPVFFGSFDWHSCVEMHWVLVRLLRLFPNHPAAADSIATLDALITPEGVAREAAYVRANRGFERTYGWAWYLTLVHECEIGAFDHWHTTLQPLTDAIVDNYLAWLPTATYPIRTGLHPNTAFGILRSLDFADTRAVDGDDALQRALIDAAARWYLDDVDAPARYEPSNSDFLSPSLCEAELMSRLLDPHVFAEWLGAFLPELETSQPPQIFTPAVASDMTDGQNAHLVGLNLARAASFVAIAETLGSDDVRHAPLIVAAERHAQASLPQVTGGHYMTEHWLSVYATLLLSQ
jgi:hypothetical protein